MSAIELIDELEAGRALRRVRGARSRGSCSEWALERFSPRIGLSTAFQIDGVALLDMAYELDPSIQVFSVDTGRLPTETYELIERLRDRYPGLDLQLLSPEARQVQAMVSLHGPNLFHTQVEKRLLLLQRPQGAAADAAPRDARCVDHRPAPRPVGDAHRHPQDRDRPRPRRDRQAQSARRVDGGRGVGLRARARRPVPPALRPRLHVDRLRAVHARARPGRGGARRPLVVGGNAPKECGIHCAVETGGLEHELHAILGEDA
jgi:phosphoadenosine phosphosulfate reductase